MGRVWRRLPTCDRCEIGERQSGYRSVSFSAFSQFTDNILLHRRFTLRRRDIAVSRNSLACCNARHLRIRHLVQFILADPVYYNALTNCATRSCCACVDLITCVAERYLTLRTGYERHGRKNPLPFLISKRSHIGNLRRIRKQGKGRSSKRKGNRRCPFLFAPAAGAATFPPSADGESPAEVQRKTLRPERANPPAAVRVPRTIGAEKEPPVRGEPACGSSSAPHNRCRKGAAPSGRTRQRQFEHPAQPVQKRSRPVRANTLTQFECPAQPVQKNFSKIFKKLTIHGQFSPPSGIGLKEVTQ